MHPIIASADCQAVRHQFQLVVELAGGRQERHDLSQHLRGVVSVWRVRGGQAEARDGPLTLCGVHGAV